MMNPWIRGLEIVMDTLSVIVFISAFAALFVVLWKRKRIEELMRTRPYRKLSPRYRWMLIAIGVLLLLAFEFIITPHFGIHLPVRTQIFLGLTTAVMYVVLMSVFFSATQRMQKWPVSARLRAMYIMLVVTCILAVASLYHAFS